MTTSLFRSENVQVSQNENSALDGSSKELELVSESGDAEEIFKGSVQTQRLQDYVDSGMDVDAESEVLYLVV